MTDETTLRGDFGQFDADGNGSIDEQEFTALLEFLDIEFSSADGIKATFAAVDTNGSGQIDFAEFRDWWLKYQDAQS